MNGDLEEAAGELEVLTGPAGERRSGSHALLGAIPFERERRGFFPGGHRARLRGGDRRISQLEPKAPVPDKLTLEREACR